MEIKTKLRILTWAMILLILFNITVLITVFSKIKNNDFIRPNNPQFNPDCEMPFDPKQQDLNFRQLLIKELELENTQINDLDMFREQFLHQSHILFDSIRIYSDLIDGELAKDKPNQDFIFSNSTKIGNLHCKLKLNFVEYYLNLKSILNKNQQKKFHQITIEFKQQKQFNHKP